MFILPWYQREPLESRWRKISKCDWVHKLTHQSPIWLHQLWASSSALTRHANSRSHLQQDARTHCDHAVDKEVFFAVMLSSVALSRVTASRLSDMGICPPEVPGRSQRGVCAKADIYRDRKRRWIIGNCCNSELGCAEDNLVTRPLKWQADERVEVHNCSLMTPS